ncbi:N-acetylmuramoyl-L-alanine amidase [Frigidibacter oleivorans]|uniref:N-acetylmuramoyl-L-alanine amidase n=1 Tax=Frigidibacter oleivorans TaxID=2487129 RepID=UPI001F18D6E5|nr:N-acetylmuramoyl-L-alanine amidase [Frigidibacter oleivorans]
MGIWAKTAGRARVLLACVAAMGALLCMTEGAGAQGRQELSALARLRPAESGVVQRDGAIEATLALSQAVPFRVFLLDDPPRLVVDFREVDFSGADAAALDRAPGVLDIRWGTFRAGWSRLVAELDGPWRIDTAWQATDPPAIRIRLLPTDAATLARLAADPVAMAAGWGPAGAAPAPVRPRRRDGPLVVVLDPGHGGLDPGAEAAGLVEKALVLDFARGLREALLREGMQVRLTREEDEFMPLDARISVARAAGADLFLSLHADALAEGQASGATVYTLDEAAADEAARLLAERHDRDDLLAGVDLAGQDDAVAGVLMDLARTETQPRSDRLAQMLAASIEAEGLRTHPHPVQAGAFTVLKAPDIPSVLLELGFLSSPGDRARLVDSDWRARMQAAIVRALLDWAEADAAEARLIRQ